MSLYDELGPYYTLIALNDGDGEAVFLDAAERADIPIKVLRVDANLTPPEYNHRFTLVRQDQHVVWRGEEAPANAQDLVETLRGNRANSDYPPASSAHALV